MIGETDISTLLARVETWAAREENRKNAPVFLPYLSGERTPHNDPEANGVFAGLRAEHSGRRWSTRCWRESRSRWRTGSTC